MITFEDALKEIPTKSTRVALAEVADTMFVCNLWMIDRGKAYAMEDVISMARLVLQTELGSAPPDEDNVVHALSAIADQMESIVTTLKGG